MKTNIYKTTTVTYRFIIYKDGLKSESQDLDSNEYQHYSKIYGSIEKFMNAIMIEFLRENPESRVTLRVEEIIETKTEEALYQKSIKM